MKGEREDRCDAKYAHNFERHVSVLYVHKGWVGEEGTMERLLFMSILDQNLWNLSVDDSNSSQCSVNFLPYPLPFGNYLFTLFVTHLSS